MNNISIKEKSLASLNKKSLYANIPVSKCIKCLKNNIILPLPVNKIIKFGTLYTKWCFFQYNGIFYKQKFYLSMCSPLSGILACLVLESNPFKFIIPKDSRYFCHVDDILFIYPRNNDLTKITDKLNKIECTIDFNYNTSLSIHTKLNICVTTKQATLPH